MLRLVWKIDGVDITGDIRKCYYDDLRKMFLMLIKGCPTAVFTQSAKFVQNIKWGR